MESTPLLSHQRADQENNDRRSNMCIFWVTVSVITLFVTIGGVRLYHAHSYQDKLIKTIPFEIISHPDPPTSLWGNVVKPYPTGAFWTNLAIGKGEDPIGLYPYAVKCLETGVHVSYPASRRHVTQITIFDDFVSDFQLSSLEEYSSRSVESHDFASVTMNYRTMTGQGYKTPLVKGSTFVTVVYTQSTPVISSSLMHLVSIEKKVIPGSKGTQYIITLGNWQKWLLYCSEPIDFIQDKDTLSSPNPITGFIRLAVLSPFSTTAMSTLMNFVAKYPIGASISFSYPASTSSAIVTYEFKTVGSGPLLMFRLPHHAGVMVSPSSNEETKMTQVAISPMYCIKGKLQVVIGETWRLKYSLPKIGFNYDAPGFAGVDKKQQMEISKSLRDDIRTVPSSMDDPYHFGKEIGRMALLAIIAEEIGDLESKMAAVTALEKALVLWLTGANVDVLVYDSTYGGVVPSLGLKNKYSDYGAGWYSDHHFHFGYFVFAAAVISKLDAKFADQYRAQLDTLVRDFCTMNPSDKEFPLVRHKDFFDGHSWASGLYTQANGKGQESSSEAVNAYYGVYLYAKVTNKGDLMNFAHLMLAMEVQATKVYWHMKSDSNIYDSLFAAGKMVGNIGALDVTTTTWFGSELEFVHGINIMPITPATSLLLDRDFVSEEWPVLGSSLPSPEEEEMAAAKVVCSVNKACAAIGLGGNCCPAPSGVYLGCCDPRPGGSRIMQNDWRSLVYADLAVLDRDVAWNKLIAMQSFGSGGSRANFLLWTATREAAKGLDISTHMVNYTAAISPKCEENSGCYALGLPGLCCPVASGLMLGCCPQVVATTLVSS